MGFGRGRKRESWSSRPLSMLLSDNVKLFNKKGKATVDKTVQDQSRRGIEGGTVGRVEQAPQPGTESAVAPVVNTTEAAPASVRASVDETRERTGDEPTNEASRPLAPQEAPAAPAAPVSKQVETPYLTLNLGDTPKSLLDHLSESYPSMDTSTPKDPHLISALETHFNSQDETKQSQILSPETPSEDAVTPTLESHGARMYTDSAEPPSAEVAAIDINQMPWAVNARDTPIISEVSTFAPVQPMAGSLPVTGALATGGPETGAVESGATEPGAQEPSTTGNDTTENDTLSIPADSVPELGYEQGSEIESPNPDASNRQNSTFSSDTQPSVSTTPDEFMLETNHKIIVNRGVYILDPTNRHDLVHATLSPDELFNPFDFE